MHGKSMLLKYLMLLTLKSTRDSESRQWHLLLMAFITVCFARQCVFFENLDLCYNVYVRPDDTNLAKTLQIIGDIYKT